MILFRNSFRIHCFRGFILNPLYLSRIANVFVFYSGIHHKVAIFFANSLIIRYIFHQSTLNLPYFFTLWISLTLNSLWIYFLHLFWQSISWIYYKFPIILRIDHKLSFWLANSLSVFWIHHLPPEFTTNSLSHYLTLQTHYKLITNSLSIHLVSRLNSESKHISIVYKWTKQADLTLLDKFDLWWLFMTWFDLK